MSKVGRLYPAGSAQDPDAVLEQAVCVFKGVLILGYDKGGKFQARGSLNLSDADCLALARLFAHKIGSGAIGSLGTDPQTPTGKQSLQVASAIGATMRKRYGTRPAHLTRAAYVDSYFGEGETHGREISVYEADQEPIDTGLLDADGNAIYSFPVRNPIGFVHFKDGDE